MFSDVLFEGVCPRSCDVSKGASGLPCQLKRRLELHSD